MPVIKDERQFRKLLEDHLVPMIAGSVLSPDMDVTTNRPPRPVVRYGQFLRIQPEPESHRRFQLWRSQAFGTPEIQVATAFVQELRAILKALDDAHFDQRVLDELLANLPRRTVVSRYEQLKEPLNTVLRDLVALSQKSYEGKPVTVAVCLDPSRTGGATQVGDYFREKFSPVLTNGIDTGLFVGADGGVLEYGLIPTNPVPSEDSVFAPLRLARIAKWANGGKVAAVLNRVGEILVFSDGCLRFARRAAKWHFFTHEEAIVQLRQRPKADEVRRAMYLSLLDVSFARTGGGIGVVLAGKKPEEVAKIVGSQNLFGSEDASRKTRLLADLVAGRKFHELPRVLRQELLGIDGATVINHDGDVLAVGAIVEVTSDVEGTAGAREKAAKMLSQLGLGVKVSQDGGIDAFIHNHKPTTTRSMFENILSIS